MKVAWFTSLAVNTIGVILTINTHSSPLIISIYIQTSFLLSNALTVIAVCCMVVAVTGYKNNTQNAHVRNNSQVVRIQGPKLTFLCRHQVAIKYFFQSPDGQIWLPKNFEFINFCFTAKHKNMKFLKTFLSLKHNPTRERSQRSQGLHCIKTLNYQVAYVLVLKGFLLNR